MPIRQHPLLRYYARAVDHIGLASLAGRDVPDVEDMREYFGNAVAALPPLRPGLDHRHDEIRAALETVAKGGDPEKGSFLDQARWAAGWLADYTAKLALLGAEIPAQIVPGVLLHVFSDGLVDQQKHGFGHRRVLVVNDFGITFQVVDGDHAGTIGHHLGNWDPESLAQYLRPARDCGPDCGGDTTR